MLRLYCFPWNLGGFPRPQTRRSNNFPNTAPGSAIFGFKPCQLVLIGVKSPNIERLMP